MQKYAMIGGILSIVSGGIGVFITMLLMIAVLAFGFYPIDEGDDMPLEFITVSIIMLLFFAVFVIVPSALAIVGGIFSIKKKIWPLALAGAIAGSFTFQFLGIAAIIFTTLAKSEFDEARLTTIAGDPQQGSL